MKVAIVTGSSNGIGLATSVLLARNNIYTYASMRNLAKANSIREIAKKENLPLETIQLDVTDDTSVKDAVNKVLEEKKTIDVLVNNAGYGLMGCVEDLSMEEVKAQFETNLFGVIRVTQAVLPAMRRQKHGMIVNVSSIAGRVGFPATSAYIGSKFALEGLSESMRYELEPFGVKVVIVEPGAIRSNFINAMALAEKASDPNSPYAQLMQKVGAGLKLLLEHGTPSEEVAKTILKAVTAENPEPRYLVGNDAAMLMEARKKMSDLEFEQFMKKDIIQ
ncbi:MAG: NAD(P)-dependent dehydrogenase (short-subunit alcohol dehydrogenase family) [Candidatus Nitrosomirales archaeon]